MSLGRDDFSAFFAELYGTTPFAWQRRLLDHLLDEGRWPELITAPTGSGKSAVVDVHVFANALVAAGTAPRLPRRLAVVVNRRALVDSQFRRAESICDSLGESAGPVTAEVARLLVSLRAPRTWAVGQAPVSTVVQPLLVTNLRGALSPTREWIDDPSACQIIAATPDMWGSRLLMRGYGSGRFARSREAGFLAYDAAVVVDEAHLNRQLATTARRIGLLEASASSPVGVPALQVVEATATPSGTGGRTHVGVEPGDLAVDEALARRLTRPKPVTYVASPAWPGKGKADRAHVRQLVDAVRDVMVEDDTVGCVVNRVDTAVRVASELRALDVSVALWVGRRRPRDIETLQREHPELFASGEPWVHPRIDVLVATQTVEVGVDLDLAHLVTELASAPALAQRAGRVNRIGRRGSGRIVVVGPEREGKLGDYLPYREDELAAARDWLARFENVSAGLAPWQMRETPPPPTAPRRLSFAMLGTATGKWLAHTSERLFEDEDLALYLRDDLDDEKLTAGVVVRTIPDYLDPNLAVALLAATPPTADETLVGRLKGVRSVAKAAAGVSPVACVFRNGELEPLVSTDDASSLIRPGDILVVADTVPCTRGHVLDEDPDPAERLEAFWGSAREVCLHSDDRDDLCHELAGMTPDEAQARFVELRPGIDDQVVLPPSAADYDVLPWVVIQPGNDVLDLEVLQETVLREPVRLEQHRANVAHRAAEHARVLGLPAELVGSLHRAGEWHDEGKRDPRFQRRLGATRETGVLAKSGQRSAQQARRAARSSGLRPGWRHEQLSAAMAAAETESLTAADLVIRLVGTSHGRGRDVFDVPAADLDAGDPAPPVHAAAVALFGPDDKWGETILPATQQRWGLWGCAYLEAVLRAADCQISAEGS